MFICAFMGGRIREEGVFLVRWQRVWYLYQVVAGFSGRFLQWMDGKTGMEKVTPELQRLIEEIPEMHAALQIEFADPARLFDMQLGYGVDVTGKDLSGTGKGEWHPAWVVFGYDYGDPVFVDTREEARGFPVYTAEHGTGNWEPQEIAGTLAGFIRILLLLNAAMEAGDIDYRNLTAKMAPHTGNMDYWDVVIEGIEDNLE
ncbi:hypothetical protein LJC19_07795 [Oxalobacter sp. OttesenSCG-928-P03]|nr:hypothetical protein [Oxalobacter sp. OttesenSCG-928-P03]